MGILFFLSSYLAISFSILLIFAKILLFSYFCFLFHWFPFVHESFPFTYLLWINLLSFYNLLELKTCILNFLPCFVFNIFLVPSTALANKLVWCFFSHFQSLKLKKKIFFSFIFFLFLIWLIDFLVFWHTSKYSFSGYIFVIYF